MHIFYGTILLASNWCDQEALSASVNINRETCSWFVCISQKNCATAPFHCNALISNCTLLPKHRFDVQVGANPVTAPPAGDAELANGGAVNGANGGTVNGEADLEGR